MRSPAVAVKLVCVEACLCAGLSAQLNFTSTTLFSAAPASFSEFGFGIAAADLNDDSFADLIVSQPEATVDGQPHAGRAWVIFGPNFVQFGSVRANPVMQTEHFGSGGFVVGDADGDGMSDILVLCPDASLPGMPNVGSAHLFLGPDYAVDLKLQPTKPVAGAKFGAGGAFVDSACASMDVLIGAPNATFMKDHIPFSSAGELTAYKASSGIPVATIYTPGEASGMFGQKLMSADLDLDGVPEVLAAAPSYFTGTSYGAIFALSSCVSRLDGVIAPADPVPSYSGFGRMFCVAGLVGDAAPDVLAGAPGTDSGGLESTGVVLLLEGPDFQRIAKTFKSPVPSSDALFGNWGAVGDFTQDGLPDIALGDPYTKPVSAQAARVYVYSGPDYATAAVLEDPLGSSVEFGEGVTAADIDGDGYDELICRVALIDASGAVHVFDPVDLTTEPSALSVSTGGDIQLTLAMGSKHAGKPYVIAMGAAGSTPGLVAGPGSYVRLNLDAVTSAGLSLLGSSVLEGFTGTLDAQGRATAVLHWPAGLGSSLAGASLTLTAVTMQDGRPSAGSSAATVALVP